MSADDIVRKRANASTDRLQPNGLLSSAVHSVAVSAQDLVYRAPRQSEGSPVWRGRSPDTLMMLHLYICANRPVGPGCRYAGIPPETPDGLTGLFLFDNTNDSYLHLGLFAFSIATSFLIDGDIYAEIRGSTARFGGILHNRR
jgi:hypothetical protein